MVRRTEGSSGGTVPKRNVESESEGSAPAKRLSLNLPADLHTRFKTACAATDRRMMTELLELVRRRTAELEEEAHLGAWGREVSLRHAGRAPVRGQRD